MLTWVAIVIGAGIGAPTRFAIDRYFVRTKGTALPYGTFVVNLLGSLILGFFTGLTLTLADGKSSGWQLVMSLIGTGFCGALTTFSGWASQVLELSRRPLRATGTWYALLSLIFGFLLAAGGYVLGATLAG